MRKVSLVSSDGIVTSFQRSILSFHSPMLARFVAQQNHEMPTHKQTNKQYIYRLMLGASNGNSTRVAINVPTTQNALVCLLKVLCNGEAITDQCSPEQVITDVLKDIIVAALPKQHHCCFR